MEDFVDVDTVVLKTGSEFLLALIFFTLVDEEYSLANFQAMNVNPHAQRRVGAHTLLNIFSLYKQDIVEAYEGI